ncbi:ubiquitin carboxyl-terminal hydrolase 10 [Achroia grisella]|uniref:ubiquitin carboxyl-terminal hydrolase 10 n=1 Tax=Achroia grisella TaxID=688607 RepID=UPI0027D33674|nr:ubiquitin carboxyl-terminal hydrolase 10 [Achroia grisella]
MDLMKTEYEFLDLSDVKEAELSSLQCALFERKTDTSAYTATVGWIEPAIDISSCSSSTAGPPTVSSSLDSLSGGECEMAPHSPQRGGAGAGPPHAQPYVQQPPAYPPPQHHQWPVAPPNVYVSQVTANVNVHGYMGQYYQPPQPQYVPPPQLDRPPRGHRRERRGKRVPSPPPPQPPPYYLQYPQYYPAAQAQGAPLYHVPMYQPLVYGPYAHPPYYYPEYPLPVEGDTGDKGPDEYAQEVVMEQEAVDAYYAGTHYAFAPPVEGSMEYMPPIYLQPPPHPPHIPIQQQPPHQSTPHQFNVHAKNFVQGQSHNKNYALPENKNHEHKTPTATVSATASAGSVESLPIKDLKITNKGPSSPKQADRPSESNQTKPMTATSDKTSPVQKTDSTKPAWVPNDNKALENTSSQGQPINKTFPPTATANIQGASVAKTPPIISKTTKGPAAPFTGGKQSSTTKPSVPQTVVPVQQAASTPKAPFGNRQKRDGISNRSPSNENPENLEKISAPIEQHSKREPPLPPSKAPMPISITLHSQGQPLIVTNKSPFGHSRKVAPAPEPLPIPQPPPPAPTASDFPPPPTPRNRGEPIPAPVVQPQPQPAPGKSWASLFSNKAAIVTTTPAPAPTTTITTTTTSEEPSSPTSVTPIPSASVQKPVAKVPPFDASPLQTTVVDKTSPTPRTATNAGPTVSYSEKTSVNAVSNVNTPAGTKSPAATQVASEIREMPIQKEPTPALPIAPSPFSDDPNSYRMGEFLTKYQLDNRPVSLLPRGLTNRSNYCYVNSILQALIACPPFYNMLKSLPYQTRRGKSSTPVIDSMVELCYEFSPAAGGGAGGAGGARGARRGAEGGGAGPPGVPGGPPLDGAAGLRVLRALRPFPGSQEGRQEDAEEFLGCLLNSLNDEMLELIKLVEPEEPKDANGQPNGVIPQEQKPEEDDDDDEWKVMGPRNRGAVERRWAARRTPVGDIFRGRTRLRLHRAPHHDVTDAVQPFFTLQLDIERANSVKDALELLAGKDTLEGVSDAWQQLSLEQLPVVLLLHLKCFQLDPEGHTAKIVKNIDFNIDLKIDPKIMSSKLKYSQKQRLYKLFAVVYHEGVEAVKGHYVTDTYHGQVGWLRYDDSTVTQVGEAQVLKAKPPRMPYLLMYRRHDTLPPPAPRPRPE